jgi:hypothetical protein
MSMRWSNSAQAATAGTPDVALDDCGRGGQGRMIAVVLLARHSYAARNSRIRLLMSVGRCTIRKCLTSSISSDCDPYRSNTRLIG